MKDKGWLACGELQPGYELLSHDDQWITIDQVEHEVSFQTVYNILVEDFHTYFVGDETWNFSVWVHNTGCELYHGSPNFKGDKFELDASFKRPTHATSKDASVFMTDDVGRAYQQYATPRGKVIKTIIPDELAQAMKQYDRYGNIEYVARTQEHVDALNRHIEIKDAIDALKEWILK